MVETSLRGRPLFSTFLQSDASAGGDGLKYYEYQRYLRSHKVAILQDKRASIQIPGSKATGLSTSRKVFQLKNRSPVHTTNSAASTSTNEHSEVLKSTCHERLSIVPSEDAYGGREITPDLPVHMPNSHTSVTWKIDDHKQSETERLPRINARQYRLVKSATARDHHLPHFGLESHHHSRPKTVAGFRDAHAETKDNEESSEKPNSVEKDKFLHPSANCHDEVPSIARRQDLLHQRIAWSECDQPDGTDSSELNITERDALAKAFTWGTTTQRAYDEVGWADRLAAQIVPPTCTIEQCPDPVSQKLTFRRYHSEPERWQTYGLEWDYIQIRTGSFPKGPLAVNYCTRTKATQQIPGYLGCVPDNETTDHPSEHLQPALLVRSLKPRPTNVARRMNIPGYTGHVQWTRTSSTHSKMDMWSTTHEKSHRPIPSDDDISPFCRNGVFSRMITTVSPHNPFNKIQP